MTLTFPCMPEQITKSESKIMDYISNNPEEFLFASIGTVGRRLGVSGTTISRFARHLGCEDYKGLKRWVAEQNQEEGPAAKMAETLSRDEGFALESWMLRQQMHIQKTLEGLDREEFQRAVTSILKSRRIFIHGKSASASLARLLLFRLRRLGIETVLLPSGGSEVLEGLANAGAEDTVVMFSFSKVSREGKMILRRRSEVGYRTIAFCSRAFVPKEEQADIQLFVYRGEAAEYHSMTAPAALIDGLVVAVSDEMGEEAVRRLSNLHQLKRDYALNR